MAAGGSALAMLCLAIFGVIFALVWLFLPFEVFGIKPRLSLIKKKIENVEYYLMKISDDVKLMSEIMQEMKEAKEQNTPESSEQEDSTGK